MTNKDAENMRSIPTFEGENKIQSRRVISKAVYT